MSRCKRCDGVGAYPASTARKEGCEDCNGTGEFPESLRAEMDATLKEIDSLVPEAVRIRNIIEKEESK